MGAVNSSNAGQLLFTPSVVMHRCAPGQNTGAATTVSRAAHQQQKIDDGRFESVEFTECKCYPSGLLEIDSGCRTMPDSINATEGRGAISAQSGPGGGGQKCQLSSVHVSLAILIFFLFY